MPARYRTEKDTLGPVKVPEEALYGAQTARAVENFPISGRPLPPLFIKSLATLKYCSARANMELKVLTRTQGKAICDACQQVMNGRHLAHFPLDVFQTGSGTSTNMNMNEVIARLASKALGEPVDPNDHVNASQSSNDTIPSCIHLSATLALESELLPALDHLARTIRNKGRSLRRRIKTGRTHLMDALPVRLDQEFGAWASQIEARSRALKQVSEPLRRLVQGGSAIGTGVNVPRGFIDAFFRELNQLSGLKFKPARDRLAGMAAQDTAVALSGELRGCAVALMKISNDLRWMNSGPLCGLAEVELPALQPGSSIMPAKVNPVIPEAVCQVAAEVMGNDATVAIAGQSGNFQLNVMLPLIAYNLLESIHLLSQAARLTADRAIEGLEVNETRIKEQLAINPMLVTGLNPLVGYKKSAAIAQRAYRERRPVLEVALEETDLDEAVLRKALDPLQFT
ncbi:lyase family protein [Motiliproteus sp. SC1-56]|uniref:class II fumarate hydratase n=1 Tax=Motiliproteus sp. SC1-56 TaxID=2799565 RepID=UPI001A8F3F7E|nr:class II fumarate hydratase [Motiliproteus sp. SC1-56]